MTKPKTDQKIPPLLIVIILVIGWTIIGGALATGTLGALGGY
jgi:hypothetical protein